MKIYNYANHGPMFRFCQISDIHLTPMPDIARKELISKRITGYANWKKRRQFELSRDVLDAVVHDAISKRTDHYAICGDLVNLATKQEILSARHWLESLGNAQTISLVCGNHDAYVPGALEMISELWSPWLNGERQEFTEGKFAQSWQEFDAHYPIVQRTGKVAFICVSTAKPTPPFNATGLISVQQLKRLEQVLASLGQDNYFRIVMLHHPPHRRATNRHKRLISARYFRSVINKSGAEVILHGHTHLDTIENISGPNGQIPVICVPATGQLPGHKKPAGRYNFFELTGDAKKGWSLNMTARGIDTSASKEGPFQIESLFKSQII